jgi:hypothetical protein
MVQQALLFREQHPDWGAPLISVMLRRLRRWDVVAGPRAVQRWLRQAHLAPAPAGRKGPHRPRSSAPHERWQVDAADQLRLAGGRLVSWLRLTDECSGAILKTVVFDSVFNETPAQAVRQAMRECFAAWGLPGRLRLDNGWPWGSWSDLPTALALDLAGLGLGLDHNDPRSPRQNGVVERSHQTTQGWAEPATCADAAELQRRCDEMDQIQRAEYPHGGGRSRLAVYAGLLAHSGRAYGRGWERKNWSMDKAKEYLAGFVGQRRVGKDGRVWVYDQGYQVGRANAQKTALVQYDPESGEWLFGSEDGVLWCKHPAEQITQDRIRSLELSARPHRRRGKS